MRWRLFIPFVVILAAGFIIYVFFLNTIIEHNIEGMGSKIVGAKVEVGKVRFNLFKLSTQIYGLKIANPKDEWRNSFEAGRIGFSMDFWALFRKKFVISEMALENARWDTKRTTSGKLPSKKQKEKVKEEAGDEVKEIKTAKPSFVESLTKKIDASKLVDINKLSSVKRITEIKNDIDTRVIKWQKDFEAKDLKAEVDSLGRTISEIKIGAGMSLSDAKNALDKLNQAKGSLDKIKIEVETKKNNFEQDLKTVSGYISEVDAIRKTDIKNIVSELFSGVTPEGVARAIFGPPWINRINSALFWVGTARKYMPKSVKMKPPKRKKGITVKFPEKYPLPGFLIRKILVSGETPKRVQFSGTVFGITNDPPVYGAPVIVDLKAWFPNVNVEKTFAQFRATLDHTKQESRDEFVLLVRSLPMKEFNLGKSDFLPTTLSIKSADITMGFVLQEKILDSNIDLFFNNVAFVSDSEQQLDNEFARLVREALSEIGKVSVKGRLSGPMENLKFEMSSNLDSLLSRRFSEVIGKRLKEEEMRIRAEIDRIVNQGRAEVQAKFDEFKSQVQSRIDSYKSTVEGQIQLAQSKIEEFKKQIESQVNQEKKRVEDEVKKKTEELKKEAEKKLKGLFGK